MGNPWDNDWSATKVQATKGPVISTQDNKMLNEARQNAEDAAAVGLEYDTAVDALKGTPQGTFAATVNNAALRKPDDGMFMGAVRSGISLFRPDKELVNAQRLKTIAQKATARQLNQAKGVQTEGDAMRALQTQIGTEKVDAVNQEIIRQARIQQRIAAAKPEYMSAWIAKNGSLQNADATGLTYDKGWERSRSAIIAGPKAPARPSNKPQASSGTNRVRTINLDGEYID